MTGSERDDELEQFLRQRTILPHSLAEAERVEPPAELDRLVLTRAREAVHRSEPARAYRRPRWALPFGLAATLIIAFVVLLQMRSPVEQDAAVPPVTAMRVAIKTPVGVEPQVSLRMRRESRVQAESAAAYNRAKKLSYSDSPVISDTAAAPTASPPSMAHADSAAAAHLASDAVRENSAAAQAEPSISVAALQAKNTASGTAEAASKATETTSDAEEKPADAVDDSARLVARAPAMPVAPSISVRSSQTSAPVTAERMTPEQWLARIARLRTEGRVPEAERERLAFERAYPGYVKEMEKARAQGKATPP